MWKWPQRWFYLTDFLATMVAWLLAYWFRFNLSVIPSNILHTALIIFPIVLIGQIIAYELLQIHRVEWRFTSIPDVTRLALSVFLGSLLSFVAVFLVNHLEHVPRSIFPLYAVFVFLGWAGTRFGYRYFVTDRHRTHKIERVLVVGAGQAGEHLVRDLKQSSSRYLPVGFVDDDRYKRQRSIRGLPVLGCCRDIPRIVQEKNIQLIFIAIPSAPAATMRRIVRYCQRAEIPYRTLPSLSDLAEGRISMQVLREVQLEDLLGRDPIAHDGEHVRDVLHNRVVLVTGGGGSIGSELCRQIIRLQPARLIVIENSEYNLFKLEQELKQKFPTLDLQICLGDVSDRPFVRRVLQTYLPNYVFHAAAYKHVPMLENQIRVAMKNNVIGTRVLAEESSYANVHAFVLISTDKAVNPTNIMGASKRIAEKFCQNFNDISQTRFITVRFGNVLGSAGSVVPIFKEQIQHGGPVTVTHREATRLFMTIPEASQLILQATALGEGGEIFVLDMGEPVKISYLAEQLIRLSGFVPGKDIRILYTGLRPGEKMHEELFHEQEALQHTGHHKILKAHSSKCSWEVLISKLDQVAEAVSVIDETKLLELLCEIVPEYAAESLSSGSVHVVPPATVAVH